MKRSLLILFGGGAVLLLGMVALGMLDVHLLAHGSIGHLDRATDQTLAQHRVRWLNAVTVGTTDLAETLTIAGVAALVVVAARLVFGRWREALFVLAVVVGEVTIFVLTTLLVHRARPTVVRLDNAPPTSSFPSGHTAASVALYGAIATLVIAFGARPMWRRLAIAIAIIVPVVVAASRLYRGMHYPTDVLAGGLLGFTWLRVASRALLSGAVGQSVGAAHSARRQLQRRPTALAGNAAGKTAR
jgi:membrane-associated phospholipid phosphatase